MPLVVDIDNNLKSAADDLFGSYGMNTAEAMKMFVYMAVKTNRFPFTFVNDYNFETEEKEQTLEEAMNDAINDTNLYGPYETAKEAIKAMLED
jgi:DNA-damage-inducible protein J